MAGCEDGARGRNAERAGPGRCARRPAELLSPGPRRSVPFPKSQDVRPLTGPRASAFPLLGVLGVVTPRVWLARCAPGSCWFLGVTEKGGGGARERRGFLERVFPGRSGLRAPA